MDVQIVDNYEALSMAGADLIRRVTTDNPGANLLLATGNTPIGMYRELARLYKTGEWDTSRVRVFQLDEYAGVGRSDPRSLYGWLDREFLTPCGISADRVVPLFGDLDDLEAACQAFDRTVEKYGGIDLSVLGLGPNGHLGFNEPGSTPDMPTRVIGLTDASIESNAVYWGSRDVVPTSAVTAGMTAIMSARQTLLVVSGARKASILARTVNGPVSTEVPASYLQMAQDVLAIADQDAAVDLEM